MNHPSPKRAAIYTRTATTQSQSGDNRLDWHVELCRRYGDGRGYTQDEHPIYQEVASGAANRNRPYRNRLYLHALLLVASRQEFDRVVVHTHDRLARNPVHVATLLEVLSSLEIEVECPTESSGADDHFLHLMHTFLVEQAHECLHHRLRRHGNAPSRLVTNDEAASLVLSFFEQAARGVDFPPLATVANTSELPALPETQPKNSVPVGDTWLATDLQSLEN